MSIPPGRGFGINPSLCTLYTSFETSERTLAFDVTGGMSDSEEEGEIYLSALEDEEFWLHDGVEIESNIYPLRRPSPDQIYEILWRTEMFQERGPQLKLHVLDNFDGPRENSDDRELVSEMDEGLWSQLSDDLIKRVLLRLPFASQCRFRAVSKALRSSLPESPPICAFENSSPLTNQLERQSVGYMSRLLGVLGLMSRKPERPRRFPDGAEECFRSDRAAEDFARGLRCESGSQSRKVHQMDLSFAPSWIIANRLRASRDGLLYMFSLQTPTTEGPSSFGGGLCILNPFTRTWTTLPPLPKLNNMRHAWQDWCEVIVDSDSPSHFVVYVILSGELERGREKWFICQYSSAKGSSWLIIPGDPESPFRHESLCFTDQFLFSWCDDRLSNYSLKTGELVTSILLGDPPLLPSDDELVEVERTEIVEHKGRIYGAMSLEVRVRNVQASVTYLVISRLGTDRRWEKARIMPEWATSKSRMVDLVDEKGVPDEHWLFLDYTVAVLGDYVCFKVLNGYIHGGNGRRVVSQNVVGFHIPSEEWKSFDLHIPHLLGATDLEIFEPKCLQVYL